MWLKDNSNKNDLPVSPKTLFLIICLNKIIKLIMLYMLFPIALSANSKLTMRTENSVHYANVIISAFATCIKITRVVTCSYLMFIKRITFIAIFLIAFFIVAFLRFFFIKFIFAN